MKNCFIKALLAVLIPCLALVGCSDSADTENKESKQTQNAVSETTQATTEPTSFETITFGRYEQDNDPSNGAEPIEWLVLARDGERALLISKQALDSRPYNDEWADVTWETCTLRSWLNNEFADAAFSGEELGRIESVTLENPDNDSYGTPGGEPTLDRVFILSMDEAREYMPEAVSRQCVPSEYAKANGAVVNDEFTTKDGEATAWWWLRTPGDFPNYAARINRDGGVHPGGYIVENTEGAIRPAMWVRLG